MGCTWSHFMRTNIRREASTYMQECAQICAKPRQLQPVGVRGDHTDAHTRTHAHRQADTQMSAEL